MGRLEWLYFLGSNLSPKSCNWDAKKEERKRIRSKEERKVLKGNKADLGHWIF